MVAVLYALAITTLINDVKRTEAFANLSKPNGSSALSSLFISAGFWWEDPIKALSKKGNNGRRSWTLLWVSIANVMAILVISPLSSGLLSPSEVQVPQRTDFFRLDIPSSLTPLNTTTHETYFRTISSVVQNLTTSAWLSDTYAVLPFWPADFDKVPFGATLTTAAQQWQGKTTVFKADLECTSMELTADYYEISSSSLTLNSPDGCQIQLNTASDFVGSSHGSWSNASTINVPEIYDCGGPASNQSNTPVCGDREVIFIMDHSYTNPTVGSMAQLCAPNYFIAYDVTTTVSNSPTGSLIHLDDRSLNWTMLDLNSSFIDLHSFETQFLDPEWVNYSRPVDIDKRCLGGPFILLAATSIDPASDLELPVDAAGLLNQARRVKQRFLGEALQAVFVSVGKQNAQKIVAQVSATKTRLLVQNWIGITLGVVLLTSAAMIALAFFCSRLTRRPLNLNQDPGSTAAVVAMISADTPVGNCFRGLDRLLEHAMKTIIGTTMFGMVNGQLVLEGGSKAPAHDSPSLIHPEV